MKNTSSKNMPGNMAFFVEIILAITLTRLPIVGVPFKWLESYFHELSHGIATLLSGGHVSHIQLFPNGAGLCFSEGGWPVLIGFSGYFGAALWGYLLFYLSTAPRGIRASYLLLSLSVLMVTVFWGRDLLTIVILVALAILFFLPLKLTHSWVLNSCLRIISLMVMLNALLSPTVLLNTSHRGDAVFLASQTWLPSWFWVFIWLGTSASMLYLSWRRIRSASTKAK